MSRSLHLVADYLRTPTDIGNSALYRMTPSARVVFIQSSDIHNYIEICKNLREGTTHIYLVVAPNQVDATFVDDLILQEKRGREKEKVKTIAKGN